MQTPPLTWQAFVLQLLQYLGPAVIALAATYITLSHQRKSKRDELTSASTLRARELMFGVYEKRLASFIDQSAQLAEEASKLQLIFATERDNKKKAEAAAKVMSIVYSQMFQSAEIFEGLETELSAAGLTEKLAGSVAFIRKAIPTMGQRVSNSDPQGEMEHMSQIAAHLIRLQRAIVEAKAKELFSDYLPTDRREIKK